MRALILVAGAALAVSACGGNTETENDTMSVENLEVENLMVNDTTGIDATNGMDANLATDMNMMDTNLSTDLNTDLNTTENGI